MQDKEIAVQTTISTLKSLIGAIPVVGGAMNEFLFETRGRIKQDRINKFVEAFANYLSELKPVQLHISQIEKEEFGDFFEEVILKVAKTKSEIKKETFKKLLANQIVKPKNFDYAGLLLEIIGNLHEEQIPILQKLFVERSMPKIQGDLFQKQNQLDKLSKERTRLFFDPTSGTYPNNQPNTVALNNQISNLETDIYKLKNALGTKSEKDNNSIGWHHYDPLLIQDLCNKGLAIDLSFRYNAEPFHFVQITRIGMDLIKAFE